MGQAQAGLPVKSTREGTYVLLQFTADPETVREFERRLRVSDLVMKFLTVRIDETMKRIEKRKKEREKRAARKPAPSLAPSRAIGGTYHGRRRGSHPGARPGAPMPASSGARGANARSGRGEGISHGRIKREDPAARHSAPPAATKRSRPRKQYFRRKKVCRFCVEKIDDINYKDVKCCTPSWRSAARSSPAASRAFARRTSAA